MKLKNLESLKKISIKMTTLFTVYLYFAVVFFLNKKTEIIDVLGVIFFLNKCGHRNVLSKRQVWMSIFHIINLKSGPVFLFQIFIIAPLPLPRDIKLYH